MKYIKLFESIYKELVPRASIITKKYLDYKIQNKKDVKSVIAKYENELEKYKDITLGELNLITDEYHRNIEECLVDIEEFKGNSFIPPRYNLGIRKYFISDVSTLDRYLDVQDKLNNIIGEDSFDIEFNIKSEPTFKRRYVTPNFNSMIDGSKTIFDFQEYIKTIPSDTIMLIKFVFKPITGEDNEFNL